MPPPAGLTASTRIRDQEHRAPRIHADPDTTLSAFVASSGRSVRGFLVSCVLELRERFFSVLWRSIGIVYRLTPDHAEAHVLTVFQAERLFPYLRLGAGGPGSA